ncbi:hypothetical protein PEAC54167_09280 [Pediococcus acidilactici]|uniref:hypothetical protein n=1 Tax=Pediococcus acidilactici TaxID=1254 RepID=UPI001E5E14C3|nr:hypothetical protein [Pediococcus acidilactici]
MCTSIELTAENGAKFWGRTMDLAMTMFGEDGGAESVITTIPAEAKIASQLTDWTANIPRWESELRALQFYLMESTKPA